MSKDLHLAQLDREEKAARIHKDLGLALERLQSNRDFKRLILDGYFRDEAVRLVHLKADPNQQKLEDQAAILGQIDAIGSLKQYLTIVEQKSRLADRDLDGIELTRSDLLSEGEVE